MWLPHPLAIVFELFADACELETITPPWLRFEVLTPRPVDMRAGTLIDYRLRLHGIPIRWRSEISAWEPPLRFIDRQIRGPYRLWVHEHTFVESGGGTLVRDRVEYQVPGGRLVDRLFVRRDLLKIFRFRQETLRRILAERAARVPPGSR